MTEIKTVVILPTLNERDNLQKILPRIIEISEVTFVIIVDDNSLDGSQEYFNTITSSKLHVINRPTRLGIGSAHIDGLTYAINLDIDLVITMDADGTHSINDLIKMIKAPIDSDVLVGSRYLSGGEIVDWSIFRSTLTRIGHFATFLLFNSSIDMSSGLRRYRSHKIPLERFKINCPSDYSFFFTSLLVCKDEGLKIGQMPITLSNRMHGSSKMDFVQIKKGLTSLFLFGLRIKRLKK